MFPLRTILHPTDFTENADRAFQLASGLARDYQAKLILLHAFPVQIVPMFEGGAVPLPMESPRDDRLKKLDQLAVDDSVVSMERKLYEGDPVEGILRVAEESGADLIVMGTH